jgi:hypothetical protein
MPSHLSCLPLPAAAALALACLATALLLLAVHQCSAEERAHAAGEEEPTLARAGISEGDAARDKFIKQVGYVQL